MARTNFKWRSYTAAGAWVKSQQEHVYFKQIVKKKKIPFEISDTRYLSIEEVAGVNWRDNLDEIEDEWE